MTNADYTIRTMRREELAIALDWAKLEGWNPGVSDAESFFAADPAGFLIGELDGEAVATVSAVRYGNDFGFIGLYIVKPEYRGRGYGLAIWEAACARLTGVVAGLDGVVAQQGNYRRSGFDFAYRHIRFRGRTEAGTFNGKTRTLTLHDFAQLAEFDRQYFGTDRADFLRAFAFAPESRAVGIFGAGELTGFGVIRRCVEGWKIGPVFAPDQAGAAEIVTTLLHTGSVGNFYWDVPEPNAVAMELARRDFHAVPIFETARMYRTGHWQLPLDRIWGTTTLELG